jgi:hypothetical protein
MDKEFDAREVYIRQPRPPSALHPEFPNPQNLLPSTLNPKSSEPQPRPPSALHPEFPNPQNPSSQLPTLDSESSAAPNPESLKPEQSALDPGIPNTKALPPNPKP